MADETFIVHSEWLDCISQMPIEVQDKIIADFVRYGCRRPQCYMKDEHINTCVNLLKSRIDYSIDKYKGNVKKGEGNKKTNDQMIYDMARQGYNAQEIADYFGVKKNTIQHKSAWLRRGEEGLTFS